MDKYFLKKTLPGCGSVRTKTAVEETFNGWFLMNTPQVSTGGVYSCCVKYNNKNQSGCNKIAVHFFSLHKGHLLCGFEFDRIPSKYMFMKIALVTTGNGGPCLYDPDQLIKSYEDAVANKNISS